MKTRTRTVVTFVAAILAATVIACGGSDDAEPDAAVLALPNGCDAIALDPIKDRFEDATGIRPKLRLSQDDGEQAVRAFCAIDNQEGNILDLTAGVLVTLTSPAFADDLFPLDDDFEAITIDGREAGYLDGSLVATTEAGRGLEIELNADRFTAAGPLEKSELRALTIAVGEYLAGAF